ncbi:MAG: transporter suffix domain-containing protein [Actinobacteria bacterium]|nr:transporter suffix domain-containing protein [Actinomycetota bacterium]
MSREVPRATGMSSGSSSEPGRGWRIWRVWVLAIGVFLVPTILYSLLLVVSFLPLTTGQKLWVASGLVVAAKGTFLLSALVLGREAVRRYRRLLDPRNWFGKKPD